jgi:hypothetical protein
MRCISKRLFRVVLLLCCVTVFLSYYVAMFARKVCYDRTRSTQADFMFDSKSKQKCILQKSNLDQTVQLDLSTGMTLRSVEASNPQVTVGGKWEPDDCDSWQRVAIIIPYRNREQHLILLLNRLHPLLKKQKIAYQIFVVEQAGSDAFNRGQLFNIGFLEALKHQEFDCFIFHVRMISIIY